MSDSHVPKLLNGGYYLDQPRKPWLVKGVIREGSTVFISGKEGTGKSFIGLEMLACIAEGRSFFGNATNQGDVIYVAAERGESQRERLEALRDIKGIDPNKIHYFNEQFKFNNQKDEELFIKAVLESGIKPKVVLIDTLRASFEGDENSSAVAQSVMDAISRCKRELNTTFVIIHHVNAFGQARGSSAFIGAADTELYVTQSKRSGKIYLTVRKQNNGKNWTRYALYPQEIQFGDGYSSIVLHSMEEEIMEDKPTTTDEELEKDTNILSVLENAKDRVSMYRLIKELSAIEGSLRNKEQLKRDAQRLANKGLIAFVEDNGKYYFGLNLRDRN